MFPVAGGWVRSLLTLALLAGPPSTSGAWAKGRPSKPKPGAPDVPVVLGDLGETIDQALRAALAPAFRGLVLVAKDGELAFAKGYGTADGATRAIGLDTLFELASASKQVTATAVLRLEQQGRLKGSDPLTKFWKGAPDDKAKVTVDHLLHHTAGLDPNLGVPYASPIGRADYVRQMLAAPLVAEPGTRFAYSNVGYALLAALVEEVTGKTFEEWVAKELFRPAGLSRTGFVNEKGLLDDPDVMSRKGDPAPTSTAVRWHYGWGYRGMGGVVSTGRDLLLWDRALRGEALLSSVAKERLWAPALEGYAGGWKVETTDRGTRRAHHSGGVMGFRCEVSRWIEEDAFLAVLTDGDGDPFAAERAILPLLFAAQPMRAELNAGPVALNESGAALATEDASVTVRKGKAGPELLVRAKRHVLAELTLGAGHLTKLRADLDAVVAALPPAAAGDPAAAIEAGLYLGPYGRVSTLRLEEQLALELRPRYEGVGRDGAPVVDERPLLLLIDGKRGAWPMMVKFNAAAARRLQSELAVLAGPPKAPGR